MSIEDRNYYNDRRVRFRAPRGDAWRLDEQRMVALVPDPSLEDCEACADDDPCERHDETEDERDARQDGEREASRPIRAPGEVVVPFVWAVCGLCDGKGKHVNPSIDCGGISGEEFDEDPDFRDAYMSGRYDVECGECHGRRVVPELRPVSEAERDALRALDAQEEDDAAYERECRAERMMGA
jgi:hypothetical protein